MAVISGTPQNDFLSGTIASDTINGGGGSDYIRASAGSDWIDGGTGPFELDTISVHNTATFAGRSNKQGYPPRPQQPYFRILTRHRPTRSQRRRSSFPRSI